MASGSISRLGFLPSGEFSPIHFPQRSLIAPGQANFADSSVSAPSSSRQFITASKAPAHAVSLASLARATRKKPSTKASRASVRQRFDSAFTASILHRPKLRIRLNSSAMN
jgi:hypothetical protein